MKLILFLATLTCIASQAQAMNRSDEHTFAKKFARINGFSFKQTSKNLTAEEIKQYIKDGAFIGVLDDPFQNAALVFGDLATAVVKREQQDRINRLIKAIINVVDNQQF